MENVYIGLAAFAVIFGGALAGLWVARRLPNQHLEADTRNAVSVSVAIVGTMSALVLSFLISTASASFLARAGDIEDIAADLARADRMLMRYGPDAAEARKKLHDWAVAKAGDLFPELGPGNAVPEDTARLFEAMQDAVLALVAKTPVQEFLRAQTLALTVDITGTRWKLYEGGSGNLPMPFVILLIFWLAIVFASFGLFAPANGTAIAAMMLSSMAVAGGLVMVLELDTPFTGVLKVPSEPLRQVLALIGG